MDAGLSELLRKGKRAQALERMVDLYGSKVLGLATAMLQDRGRAEEVTQDIFLKLWQVLPAYDGRASPSTWLYTIARNTCLSALRSENLRKTLPLGDSPEPGIRETVTADVTVDQLLRQLPEAQREVITLFYLQDQSIGEVAQQLDLPEGTVKSHLHRARRTLGGIMKE